MTLILALILAALVVIIILLATPNEDARATAVMLAGVTVLLVSVVGWGWAGVLLACWGLWRIIRYVRWDKDWRRRRHIKTAGLNRQLTKEELDYLNKPGMLL
ncbi:MAG TPA: hypothetical protein VGG14_16530 [Candidatus Sulfotelmatobacter sp.]|jgi:hypothetical protein